MRAAKEIRHIVVAGAGTIGTAVAQIFAQYDYRVTLYDIEPASLAQCKETIRIAFQRLVDQGTLSADASEEKQSKLAYTTGKDIFRQADYVVENILEDLETKKVFWFEISRLVAEDVVLTTNTSGLSVGKIAEAVSLPARFAGMHWANPPHLFPLVEIVSGEHSAPDATDIIYDICIATHRKPVRVKDIPGFVFNRLQFALLREALYLVEQGVASAEDVDSVMKSSLGIRYATVGPFETADLGGVDIFYQISSYLFAELSDAKTVPKPLRDAYQNGNYGIKTGAGFYNYPDNTGQVRLQRRNQLIEQLRAILHPEL